LKSFFHNFLSRLASFRLAGVAARGMTLAAALLLPFSAGAQADMTKPTDVLLSLTQAANGQPVTTPVKWTVTRLDKSGKLEKAPAVVETAPVLKTALKPGQYMVLAQAGPIATKQALIVGSTPLQRNLTIGGGQLFLNMVTNIGQRPLAEPILWEVYTYAKGSTEKGVKVTTNSAPTASFSLAAGTYVIRATYKDARADLVVPLQAGQSYKYTINLYAGEARLEAVRSKEQTNQPISWQIVRDTPNSSGEYELIATSQTASPKLVLREGHYRVIARSGEQWGVAPLTVGAGRTSSIQVKLRTGGDAPVIAANN